MVKALRRKGTAKAPARRLRPDDIEDQLKDVRAFMLSRAAEATTARERSEWENTDRANVVLVRDTYGTETWGHDSAVHAERAADVAVLREYHALMGLA